ncbi:MAG: WecB/TagA/CpsF family glycosyltransferase [Steroidobacteraceae bacterium]
MREVSVGGVRVSSFGSLAQCAEGVLENARGGRGGFAVAINAEKVISAFQDRTLAALIDRATLRYPDGAGVVVAMRFKGVPTVRVAGADLWLEILRAARGERLPIALIGSSPRILAATRARLEFEFPLVDVCLARDGYEGARDTARLLEALHRTRPRVVFVAMGSPRQEALIEALRRHYASAFYLGLGGSFDVYCGAKRRAPLWMQNHGLEWLFRFLSEPSRAWRETKRLRFLMLLAARRL